MAEIGGQRGKQTLHVRILSDTTRSADEPRMCGADHEASVGSTNRRDARCLRSVASARSWYRQLGWDRITALRLKQGAIWLISSSRLAEVLPCQPLDIGSERHEPRLIKLRIPYGDDAERQIYIHEPKTKRFAEPHARCVQKQQQGAECAFRHDTGRFPLTARHGVEKGA